MAEIGDNERNLDFAERLGEHGARIAAVERGQGETNNQLREIRDLLREHKAVPAVTPASSTGLELAVHRLVDHLAKPPPATTPIEQITQALQQARRTDPIALIGYIIGAGALGWFARMIIPGV